MAAVRDVRIEIPQVGRLKRWTVRARLARAGELLDVIEGIRAESGDSDRARDLRRVRTLERKARGILTGVMRSPRATERDRAEAGRILGELEAF